MIWPTREVLNGIPEYLRLAVPSVIFYAAFWFCLEIYVLVAGNLSPANQACTSIALSIIVILDTILEGGIQGTCAIVGGEIAKMRISFAKRSYRVILTLEITVNLFIVALLALFRN